MGCVSRMKVGEVVTEIEEIIAEHGDYLLRVAYLYVKNNSTAEDIVQDVFIAFYEKQDQYRGRHR